MLRSLLICVVAIPSLCLMGCDPADDGDGDTGLGTGGVTGDAAPNQSDMNPNQMDAMSGADGSLDTGLGGEPGNEDDAGSGGTGGISGDDSDMGSAGESGADEDAGMGGVPTVDTDVGAAGTPGMGGEPGIGGEPGAGGEAGMGGPPDEQCEPDDCGPRPALPVCEGGSIECIANAAGRCTWSIDNPDADNDGLCDSQDSNCNLDGDMLRCRRRAPDCPDGTVPAVENGCYTNECVTWAACAGDEEEMGNPGAFCGSRGMPPCRRGQFCNFPMNAQCGRADVPGRCADIPQQCNRIRDPVCGCDGVDYANPCIANRASVSVDYPGMCERGEGCRDDQYEIEGACYDSCRGDGDCDDGLTCNANEVCLGVPDGGQGGVGAAVCFGWCARHR